MTSPTQGEVRSWARSQGISVNPRGSLPASTVAAYLVAQGSPGGGAPSVASQSGARPAEIPDLANAMRGLLDSIDAEVEAVSSLSDSIDGLVDQLNAVRQEQAVRLTELDQLQAVVVDPTLGAFLQKAIRPRRAKVAEIVPARLQ